MSAGTLRGPVGADDEVLRERARHVDAEVPHVGHRCADAAAGSCGTGGTGAPGGRRRGRRGRSPSPRVRPRATVPAASWPMMTGRAMPNGFSRMSFRSDVQMTAAPVLTSS